MTQAPSSAWRPRRSALYLPASNARAVAKARTAPCDVVILDLEDSVGPDAKNAARDGAVQALKEGGFADREVVVRPNALSTPWGAKDLQALAGLPFDAILVPKPNSPADLAPYAQALCDIAVWAMVETCASVLRIDALAGAGPFLKALVLGTNDLAKEMGCTPGEERVPLQPAMAAMIMAARAHGLAALDGVWNAIEDLEGLDRQSRQAATFGFDGKTLIHPSHLDACNRAFTPAPDAVDWARRVADAYALPENQGAGVIRLEGKMVERLHLEQAQRVLAIAARVG